MRKKGEIYDVLYRIAITRLSYYDPCKWMDGKCERDRLRGSRGGCCGGCSYLSEKGCTTNPLGCKLWICSFVSSKNPELSAILETLKSVAYAFNLDVSLLRKSKDEICKKE